MSASQREGRSGQERAPGRSYVQSPTPGRGGLVTLGAPKRGRGQGNASNAPPAPKLAIPKPVNLPSLKKENAGLDPNTQLVPVAGGGWNKPEEPPPAQPEASADDASPLTAGSTWGSAQSRSAAAPWQPPDPSAPAAAPVVPFKVRSGLDRRRLNPSEYPSLEAAGQKSALVAQLALNRPPTSALLGPPDIGSRNWDDEDRVAPAPPPRPQSADWHGRGSRPEDERRPFGRPVDDVPPPFGRPEESFRRIAEEPTALRLAPVEDPALQAAAAPPASEEQLPDSQNEPSWEREPERDQQPSGTGLRERERSFPAPQRHERQPEPDRWRSPPPAANGRAPRSALTDAGSDSQTGSFGGPRGGYNDRGPPGRRGSWDEEPRRRYDDRDSGFRRPFGDGPTGSRGQTFNGPPRGRYDTAPTPLRSALTSGPPYDSTRPLHSALAGPPQPTVRCPERRPTLPGSQRDARPLQRSPPPVEDSEEQPPLDDSEVFNAELDRIAAEKEERKKAKEQEAAAAAAAAIEAKEAEEAAAAATERAEEARRIRDAEIREGRERSLPKARAEALAAEAEAEERRKSAALAKLEEINARIAAREAEAAAAAAAEKEAAEAKAAEEAKVADEAKAAQEAARKAEEEEAAADAETAAPAVSEAETTPLLSSTAAIDPAPPLTLSPPPALVPPVNAWSKPLSLGSSNSLQPPKLASQPEASVSVATEVQAPQPAGAISAKASAAASNGAGHVKPDNAWGRPGAAAEESSPADAQTGQRGGRGGRGRRGTDRAVPRDIIAEPGNRHAQQPPPPRSSPKDGPGRKRNRDRDRNKPPGRTLPLPVSPPGSRAGTSPPTSPADRSPAAPPASQASAPVQVAAPLQEQAQAPPSQQLTPPQQPAEPQVQQQATPLPVQPLAKLSNGLVTADEVPAVGSAIADLVLMESPGQPELPKPVTLDPVVPAAGGAAPISRPRARAALDDTLVSGVLANGIPALPADLSLDAPGGLPPGSGHGLAPPVPSFGGFQPQQSQQHGGPAPHAQGIPTNAFSGAGGFGFGGFGFSTSVPASAAGLWQQPLPPQQQQPPPPQQQFLQQQHQQLQQQPPPPPPGLLGSQPQGSGQLDAFYGGGQRGGFGSGSFGAPNLHQQNAHGSGGLQAPHFGAFGRGGGGGSQESTFGGFGQTAFVPTGKQPDWSVPSMGAGGSLQPGLGGSASQGFAAGRTGSGGLGGMPLQAPMQQEPDHFQPSPLGGQQHVGFGMPGQPPPPQQQQQGNHGFFNQAPQHNPLGLAMMGGGSLGGSGGLQLHDTQLPEDLVGSGEEAGIRQRPGVPQRRDGKSMRGGRSGPPGQFGGPSIRGGGRGPQRGQPIGRGGGRGAPGGRVDGRSEAMGRGGRAPGRGRGGRSPAVMKPVYANKQEQQQPGYGNSGGAPQPVSGSGDN